MEKGGKDGIKLFPTGDIIIQRKKRKERKNRFSVNNSLNPSSLVW
jgi:hypothetical protein